MAESNFADSDLLRLRVFRDAELVSFYGCIGDTPELNVLDGILAADSICDFKNLAFASWIGLATFGSYVQSKNFILKFRNLPFNIYDSFRLMKCFKGQIVESAELPLVNLDTGQVSFQMLEMSPLRDIVVKGLAWIYPSARQLLLIPAHFIFSELNKQIIAQSLNESKEEKQNDSLNFWLSYGSFCQSSIEISSSLVFASRNNLLHILSEIRAKMLAGEQALRSLDSMTTYTVVQRIDHIIKETAADLDLLAEKMQGSFDACEQKLANLCLKALAPEFNPEEFAQTLENYAETVITLAKVASNCEDCGGAVGSRLAALRSTQVIRMVLASVNDPSPEIVNDIRLAFAISDIMSEDDWFATRQLVMIELEAVETLIGRCVVTLQVFDMMRQILEHRIREMEIVEFSFRFKGKDSLLSIELKESVLTKIGANMVTDQEKVAFEFYLPDGFKRFGQVERNEPGDVLLF